MRAATVLAPQRLQPIRDPGPHWADNIVARALAPWIDRELAAGERTWSTVAHPARAVQLTSRRRRSLAQALELLAERAEQPAAGRSTAIPPCHEQVREALPEITHVAACLRSAEPIDARGVAKLRALLSDGDGPCYRRSHPDALTDSLREVSRWLGVAG
jgi:hypothetical protein